MTNSYDAYLSNISNESLEVLSHFGPEAPVKLNTYACQVEDSLLRALQQKQIHEQQLAQQAEYIEKVQSCLQAAQAEHECMMQILSDPDQLLDYVSKFFGPEGPYPGELLITRCHHPAQTA
jgi:hypothetical protein